MPLFLLFCILQRMCSPPRAYIVEDKSSLLFCTAKPAAGLAFETAAFSNAKFPATAKSHAFCKSFWTNPERSSFDMMQLDQRCNLKPFKRCIIEQHADVKLPMHKRFLNLLTACYLHKGSTSAHPTVQPRPCLHALRLAGCNPRTHLLSHHTAPAPKSHKNTHPPRAALYSNHGMLSFPCFHLRSRSDIKSRHYYEHTKEQAPKKLLVSRVWFYPTWLHWSGGPMRLGTLLVLCMSNC